MKVEVLQKGIEAALRFVVDKDRSEEVLGFDPDLLWTVLSVHKWEGLVLLNYKDAAQYHFNASTWSPFLTVCRGLVLREEGGLVSFPFHKFFNLGEIPEGEVARWTIKTVTEKVDGVMIQVFQYRGRLIWASRHQIWSEAAIIACKMCSDLTPLLKEIPFKHWTLVMELICPEKRKPGMVNYGDLRALVPLAVRDLDSLTLVSACEVFKKPLPEPFLLPQQYRVSSVWEARDIVRSAKEVDWEGLVLQGAEERGNLLVKLKSPLYLDRLAAIKHLSRGRVLKNYEEGGLPQVYNLFSGYEEVVKEMGYDKLIEELKSLEAKLEAEALSYRGKPVAEIPQKFKWVNSYEVGSPKWGRSLRRLVLSYLEVKKDEPPQER